MLISTKWLREMVALDDIDNQTIADRLTLSGLEVEGMIDMAADIHGVIVAQVAKKEPHPDADRLNLCQVETGTETVQVVCGATNFEQGDLVAFAPVGTVLPGGLKIKKAKIRGQESFGMICSEKELGLSTEHAGIMNLTGTEGAKPGLVLAELLGRDDVVLEIGVTPNRPDALSHIGVAREVSVALEARRKVSAPTCAERGAPIDSMAHVTIQDPDGCPRYGCRVLEDVQVGPSPAWLVSRLASCGVRSVSNIVDITNLVMMERGIPLHAFDLDTIGKDRERAEVIVRTAEEGETLTTLDDKERTLSGDDLVIADPVGPIALAGVMGGARTEVSDKTTRILLECAYFAPSRVRRTAKRHQLHSEASHRFERGADPNGIRQCLDRAASLIAELGNGRVARGTIDVYPKKMKPVEVSLRPERVAELTGLPLRDVDEARCSKLLLGIGLEVSGREGRALRFRVPTYRPDLTREVDLIEEVLRLIGYDAVPPTLPARSGEAQGLYDVKAKRTVGVCSRVLKAAGFSQAINFSFMGPKDAALFVTGADPVEIKNPLGEEMSLLRQSLYPALLKNVALNQRRGAEQVRLFEVGSVFVAHNPNGAAPRLDDDDGPLGGDAFVTEEERITAVLTGPVGRVGFDHRQKDADFYDLKGTLEDLLEAFGLEVGYVGNDIGFSHLEDGPGHLHPRARAEVTMRACDGSRCPVGTIGELHPDVLEAYDIKGPVFGFELRVQRVTQAVRDKPEAAPLPRFPSVRRDLAFVVDDSVLAGTLCRRLAETKEVKALLEDVDVFDVYKGEQLPAGKKSMAVSFVLRADDRTLTDKEIAAAADALVATAEQGFGAEVRG